MNNQVKTSQPIANTITNPTSVVKTKEREREREKDRDRDKDKEKDSTIATALNTTATTPTTTVVTVKSNSIASNSSPSKPKIKNKAQLKQLPEHIDNNDVTTIVVAAPSTVSTDNAIEIVKEKSLAKPEKEKLINEDSSKSHRDSGDTSKGNNSIRRSSDRKLTEKEQALNSNTNSNEKTKLSDDSTNAIVEIEPKVVDTPQPPPAPPLPPVEPEKPPLPPSRPPVVEKKDEIERNSRANRLIKLPTNTKRTKTIQQSSSPVRPVVMTTQTPTRQQRNCTFEQAICNPTQNVLTKQKADENSTTKTGKSNIVAKRPSTSPSNTASPTVKAAEKKCSTKTTGVRPTTVEKLEYTMINGMRVAVPQRAKLDRKMFTCFVRMNDKPNLKRKANGQLADVLPQPVTKKRKNAKNHKVEAKQPAIEQSIESVEKIEPEPIAIPVQATSAPKALVAETIATPIITNANVAAVTEAESDMDAISVSCDPIETPKRSILQKTGDRLKSQKRVSFSGIPASPPLPSALDTESKSQSLSTSAGDKSNSNNVKLASNSKKTSEKPKKLIAVRPPTPPLPTAAKAIVSVEREKKEHVETAPIVMDTTKKVVEAVKPLGEQEKLSVTPTEARLRSKKITKNATKLSMQSSKGSEQKSNDIESSPSSATKVINTIVPVTIPPLSQGIGIKGIEKNSPKMVPPSQSKLAASIDNNNAISVRPNHNKPIENHSVSSFVEEEHAFDTDNGLDCSTQKPMKKKQRKSYTKRTKSAKSTPTNVTPKAAAPLPKAMRGRPRKNQHNLPDPDPDDSIDAIETNSVEIVNLEEIKRNKVLLEETIEEYPAVSRSTCVMLDDKDEDDVKMVMDLDPLAIGVCPSSPVSSPTRMPLPMPMLIHRSPDIHQQEKNPSISSPPKQLQLPKKLPQITTPTKTPSPIQKSPIERPESTQKSPDKVKPSSPSAPSSTNSIRLKISPKLGKVTEISPSKCTTTPTDSNSPKAGARNRTKRIRKRKQHKDFIATESESDDYGVPNEKTTKYLHAPACCHANGAESSIVSSVCAHDSVDQISVQLSPTPATAAAIDTSPIASPQYSPVSKTPAEPLITEAPTCVTTTTTTAPQQYNMPAPSQYDERVFRAFVLVNKVDQIPQVNNNATINTMAGIAPATHVINTQPLTVSIQIPTSVSMAAAHENLSNEPMPTNDNFPQLQTIQQQTQPNSSDSNNACDPHSVESFVESCQQFQHCMESIESEANSMNVIQNYTTLNDGTINDGVYELQEGTLCENIESPSMPACWNSPATVDSTTSGSSGYSSSSATATQSVYLLTSTDTQALNTHSIDMSNGLNADSYLPFVSMSDILEILGSHSGNQSGSQSNDVNCGEAISMENISLDSTVAQAPTTEDTRTYYLTEPTAIAINAPTINTVHAVMPTITTAGINNIIFRTKLTKQMDSNGLQLNVINADQLIHHQQQQQQQMAQPLQQQIINMHGHHLHQQPIQHHNNMSPMLLRADNPILNAYRTDIADTNDETENQIEMAMVSSSVDSDNATPPLSGSEVNNCNGSNSNDGGGNSANRRSLFSTPSKRCGMTSYLSNDNVSIDDFISESNQLVDTTTDFFTLEI